MRRLGSITDRVRAARTRAPLGAFVLVVSGCQLITGSYSVGSTGPVCSSLAGCCASLSSGQQTGCFNAVASENEDECADVRAALPSNACSPVVMKGSDGGGTVIILLPDAHTHHDGPSTQEDTSTPHDAAGPHDATQSGSDAGEDVTPGDDSGQAEDSGQGNDAGGDDASDALSGTWSLTAALCQGQSLTLDGTTTLTFSSGSTVEEEDLSDGCDITQTLAPDSITDTTISSTASSVSCGSGCTTNDDCTSGVGGAASLSYTLSDGVLTITEAVDTTTCASGTLDFTFTME